MRRCSCAAGLHMLESSAQVQKSTEVTMHLGWLHLLQPPTCKIGCLLRALGVIALTPGPPSDAPSLPECPLPACVLQCGPQSQAAAAFAEGVAECLGAQGGPQTRPLLLRPRGGEG